MTQLSFHNIHNTRRNFLVGAGALVCASLFPDSAFAMASRVRRQYVSEQVSIITTIIEREWYALVLSNRYLASAVYYSSAFLSRVTNPRNQVDVPTTIIGQTGHLLTTQVRRGMLGASRDLSEVQARAIRVVIGEKEVLPLRRFSFGHGINHTDAVDLFTREGTPVYAFASGIVLLADSGWVLGDERSAASMKGGNTIIVFNHAKSEFYRYAHLGQVSVRTGQLVTAGMQLGTVGNTGTNAMRPGHGGHLHFEINLHDERTGLNHVVTAGEDIRQRLVRLL